MQAIFERLLNVLLFGLLPPIPNEMRSDYVTSTPEEQEKMRLKFATRQLLFLRMLSTVCLLMLAKWAWELGLLAFIGLGAGNASANDMEKTRSEIQVIRTDQVSFKQEYRRTVLQDRIRDIDAEKFQLEVAVAAAGRAGRAPDTLHLKRISELNTERENVIRQLYDLSKPVTLSP